MTQSIGIVGAKEVNQNGKQKICIDGQWYYGGNTDVSHLVVGQRIDFEWNTFGAQNNLRGLQSWGLTPNQPTPEEVAAAKPQEKKPWAGKGGGGFSRGQDRGLEIDLQCMRFIGQTVGGAIEQQKIVRPDDIAAWVKGAYEAIQFAKSWGGIAPMADAAKVMASPELPSRQESSERIPPRSNTPSERARPTGNFGWGKRYKDTLWSAIDINSLIWFKEESDAPADVKRKCADELFFREQAKGVKEDPAPVDDFSDEIPF